MRDFLLEIGCENIPASFIPPAVSQLRALAAERLEALRLPYGEVYTSGTPRRLVLIAKRLAPVQKSRIETVTGPPLSKSFSDDGTPTRAVLGFAKSQGVPLEKLEKIETEKGVYMGFTKRHRGLRTQPLLKRLAPELIASLKFPKTMRWESSGARFARPIRWMVCLYGDSVIRFRFAGVSSGDVSYYVPWVHAQRIRISSAERYREAMARTGIIVDQDERRSRIETLARRAAARRGLTLIEDEDLFQELTFMLEDPRVFIGGFPDRYLSLPPEVVVTAMKAHQRYFAVRRKGSALVSKFIAFSEGRMPGTSEVKRGNERVLEARLEDAFFYWQEDLKQGIEGLSKKLEGIVFIEGLGTLEKKAERLENLMRFLKPCSTDGVDLPDEKIARVARLAKADIASEMVKDGKEFVLLEGLIGSHYAESSGEDTAVVDAIRDQYRPRFPSDALPRAPMAKLLGIADRIDTVCGCFLAELIPSGSQDPYGLRRLSNGLMRILVEEPGIHLDRLIERAVAAYADQGFGEGRSGEEVVGTLRDFFASRCEAYLSEQGLPYDVVRAVGRVGWARPGIALVRCRGIEELRGDGAFERLITGIKRVGNILPKGKKIFGASWDDLLPAFLSSGSLRPDIQFSREAFRESMETALLVAIRERIEEMADLDAGGDFTGILRVLSTLGAPIDAYFEQVLVNCDDPALRINRIHFLACVFALFSRYADFSLIVEDPSRPS